jgi:transposase InsO family protein
MTNNGSAYRSRHFADAVATTGLRHIRTRPYMPRTNGKAERFILSSLTFSSPVSSGRRHAALEQSPTSRTLGVSPPHQPYRQGQPPSP